MSLLSHLSNTLIPSEIIKLGNEINDKIRQGQKIYNFTIGDFNPDIFPIPQELEEAIIWAYKNKRTNYPPANGIVELRESVANFIKERQGLDYPASCFLISGGGRPLIYAAYRAICDKGEKIIYPVPSWNNNHYTHFVEGEHIAVETQKDSNFLPVAEDLIPHFKDATLLALCSPLNPSGTIFTKEQLSKICEAVIEENKRRGPNQKPLYILYDQIYWTLIFGDGKHHDPVSLYPELREYTLFIDGISKSFCATGVRVGWAFGPADLIDKMKGILSHVGAWSPMAEQVGTANFLRNDEAIDAFMTDVKASIYERLQKIYEGFIAMKNDGYPVDIIAPQAAIYLTIKISLRGRKSPSGKVFETTAEATSYLLSDASLAIVPFSAFGADASSEWYRLSVGTSKLEEIPMVFEKLRAAIDKCEM